MTGKLQIPNSKLHPPSSKALWRTRRSSKLQAPSSKKRASSGVLLIAFGSWDGRTGESIEFVGSAVPSKGFSNGLPNVKGRVAQNERSADSLVRAVKNRSISPIFRLFGWRGQGCPRSVPVTGISATCPKTFRDEEMGLVRCPKVAI
jgi:hypothetical protein